MIETSQIKEDLKEIRYYYEMKKTFDSASAFLQPKILLCKVDRYNAAVKNAPAKLFIIYYSLYVEGNTHERLAEEWGYSRQYISTLNDELVKFLQKNLMS